MLNKFCLPLILLIGIAANGQYKNDNVLFKTVDPADLCNTLEKNKGYILLDVRSRGEYSDTSTSPAYNLGHLKGAVNIDIRELGKRIAEIEDYKTKPVFVYCSHSQRSRRANKMLADSGFTNLFNINGGMTAIHYNSLKDKGCLKSLVETGINYNLISANEVCSKMAKDNGPFLLDVRSDSAFRHISLDAKENAYGFFRGTVNIPLLQLSNRLSKLPKQQEIIITDIDGDEASLAAVLLKKGGFSNVAVLIEGIDRLLYSDEQTLPCKNILYQSPVTYKILSAAEFGRYTQTNTNFTLLDIRSAEEFGNKHKDSWRNIGHLKNAVNIPASELEKSSAGLGNNKDKEIVIYNFGNSSELYAVADGLKKEGFTKIKVLVGGIFNIRWTAANVKGQSYLKDMVTDVPEINW